jgi:fucose permease
MDIARGVAVRCASDDRAGPPAEVEEAPLVQEVDTARAIGLLDPPFGAYCLTFAAFGLAGNSLGPMLPSIAAVGGVETSALSPIIAAGGIGGLVGASLCPALPLRLLVPGGMVALALTYAMVPMHDSVPALTAVFGAAATCAQAVAIGGHAEVARAGGSNVTSRLNGINAAFGMGSLLAPWFHEQMRTSMLTGTQSYWPVSALLLATAAPFVASARRAAAPTGHHTAPQSATPVARQSASMSMQLGGPTGIALTASVLALVCCSVGAEVSYASWLYTHAVQGMQLSGASAAAVVSCFWAMMTIGRLTAAGLASRGFGPSTLLRASLPFAVVGPALALTWPSSGQALTAGMACAGLGLSTGFANSVALLATHVTPTGTTQSLIQLAACAGALVFAPLAGLLAHNAGVGTSACLWVAGGCAALDVVALLAAEALAARMARAKRQ